jgi:hypothetical protein
MTSRMKRKQLITFGSVMIVARTVGTRTTGMRAGDYFVAGPGWKRQAPSGMMLISSPNNSVLVIGRILVYSDDDLPTASELTKQIHIAPLTIQRPSTNPTMN